MIYIILIIFVLLLSIYYDINGNEKNKNLWFIIIQFILIVVAGIRYRIGSDTTNYLFNFYHEYPLLSDFSFEDYPIGKDPFYVLINSFIKSLGGRFYIVQFVQATIVILLLFKYIKKHSNSIFTCVFFLIITSNYFYYCMEIMRGGISVVICLYANDYIIERKWIKGYILYAISVLFHIQAVLILLTPLLFFLRFNKKGIIILMGALVVGRVVQSKLLDIINMMDLDGSIKLKASSYALDDAYGQSGGNLNFLIVFIFPMLIYSLLCLYYSKKDRWCDTLIKIQPFVMIGTLFLIIQLNVQIAYRYVDYYTAYILIYMSEQFVSFFRNKRFGRGLSYFRVFVFFLPFFFLTGYRFYKDYPFRYLPYSTIFDLEIDHERESGYAHAAFPAPRLNEY